MLQFTEGEHRAAIRIARNYDLSIDRKSYAKRKVRQHGMKMWGLPLTTHGFCLLSLAQTLTDALHLLMMPR